ncbi:putative calcium-binding protein CML15 [Camellia lanceoleosa]|uniref:Calcium-binding protein CML15 n=1 Tax=Camellia lanceoleosa TaxID=1840588 RepID=A0ACC0FAD3_9ERIC|nr:putative calcium-binding protein CML15 [Camellia lanceoleosa]
MISLPKYNHQNLLLLLPTTTTNPTTFLLLLLLCDHLHPTTTTTTIIMSVVFEVNQLDQLRDIFSRFDMDSDGSLTLLELAALLRSLGIKPSGDQIHVLLANMDANGNGTVEFDELVNAITPHMTEDLLINQGQLLEVFKSFDRDGNGYITLAELAGSMAKWVSH